MFPPSHFVNNFFSFSENLDWSVGREGGEGEEEGQGGGSG